MADRISERCANSDELCKPVCVHTSKIIDSCLNQDCVEDLRVYLTRDSQCALDRATGAKARCCELIHAQVYVEAIPYNAGHYTVDVTYFYRITGDINTSGLRTCTLCGLAVFNKRVVLCGGAPGAKSFSSRCNVFNSESILHCNVPEAIVEVIDPMILSAKVIDACHCECGCSVPDIPTAISDSFGDELIVGGEGKQLYVTLGQFSTIRLERDTQLQIPNCRNCIPTKECCDDPGCAEEPCEVFSRMSFPVQAFFPSDCECNK